DRVLVFGEYAEGATASVGRRTALDRDRNPCLLPVGPPTHPSRVDNGLICGLAQLLLSYGPSFTLEVNGDNYCPGICAIPLLNSGFSPTQLKLALRGLNPVPKHS